MFGFDADMGGGIHDVIGIITWPITSLPLIIKDYITKKIDTYGFNLTRIGRRYEVVKGPDDRLVDKAIGRLERYVRRRERHFVDLQKKPLVEQAEWLINVDDFVSVLAYEYSRKQINTQNKKYYGLIGDIIANGLYSGFEHDSELRKERRFLKEEYSALLVSYLADKTSLREFVSDFRPLWDDSWN